MSIISPSTIQYIFFVIYYLSTILLLFYVNLSSLKLASSNRHTKKIIYLAAFLLFYLMGKIAFKELHTLVSTALPLVTMYALNTLLQGIAIVGLTGGIACGKSTLVKVLKQKLQRMVVIDCDEISKRISLPGEKGYDFIIKILGDRKREYVDPNNKLIIRQKLSQLAFQDKQFRKKLTSGLGRFIFWKILKSILGAIISGQKLILIDAPILYQTKFLQYICYPIIVVYVDLQTQIARLSKRNGYSREEAMSRIQSQMPINQKIKRANISIRNVSTEQELLQNCLKGLGKFIQL